MKTVAYILLLCLSLLASAQIEEPKFGKIDPSELSMTRYDSDTTADALILFDYGITKFNLSPKEDFQYTYTRHCRIKIFRKSAFGLAEFKFRLYQGNSSREKIGELKAYTYNLVEGKIVKTKLDNDNIYSEESGNYIIQKFALPQVKEGSVIELSYAIVSDFLYNLRGWNFQYSIPAVWSQYIYEIPEYFNYQKQVKGYLPFDIDLSDRFEATYTILQRGEMSIGYHSTGRTQSERVNFKVGTNRHILAIKNVPAFRSEPNIDCEDNYIQSLEFELGSIKYPNSPIQEYSKTWESVNDQMNDDEDFGKLLKGDNFINDTVTAICKGISSPSDKAIAIYSYVQRNMKWNGEYKLWATRGLKKPFTEHAGNSAEINLLLTLMLKSAGLNADPVMFSTRGNGIALSFFPTITKYNSVLTRLVIDTKPILLDATSEFCPFGSIPPNDINDKGRVVNNTGGDWVNLDTKLKYTEMKNYVLNIQPDGNMNGYIRESYDGYAGMAYREDLKGLKSEDDYMKQLQEKTKGLTINTYMIKNKNDIYKPIGDSLCVDVSEMATVVGDKILLQPLLFETIQRNRYTLEERKYPVNYNFPISETYLFEYMVPDGYAVESLPKSTVLKTPDNSITVYYDLKNNGNKIILTYKRSINKIMFIPEEYKPLKDHYDQLVKKHAENIILKKVS